MIYKLIILTASLLFIWEFMKVRSTAVAQVEPKIIKDTWHEFQITSAQLGMVAQVEPKLSQYVVARTGLTSGQKVVPYGADSIRKSNIIASNPYLALKGV